MKYLVTVSFTQSKELTIYAQSEAEAEEKAVDIVLKWANVDEAEAIDVQEDDQGGQFGAGA